MQPQKVSTHVSPPRLRRLTWVDIFAISEFNFLHIKGAFYLKQLTITRRQILDWSTLKQSADDTSEFDVNSRKFSKLVEKTVGKREIVHYEQFLLFPQCFQKACFPGASEGVILWEWVNAAAKSNSPCQPTKTAQADMGCYFCY